MKHHSDRDQYLTDTFRVCVFEDRLLEAAGILDEVIVDHRFLQKLTPDMIRDAYDRAIATQQYHAAMRMLRRVQGSCFYTLRERMPRDAKCEGFRIWSSDGSFQASVDMLTDPRVGQIVLSGGSPDTTGFIKDGEEHSAPNDETWVRGRSFENRLGLKDGVKSYLPALITRTDNPDHRALYTRAQRDFDARDACVTAAAKPRP